MRIGIKTAAVAECFVVILFAVAGVALADYQPENWRYFKDIRIGDLSDEEKLVKINLDQEVFNGAKDDLSDLRIVDNDGTETAYKLIVEKGIFSKSNVYPIRILNNSFVPKEYNSFIVDFGKSGFLNSSLKINVSSENFKRRVEISGGNRVGDWRILKSDGYIYDYTDSQISFKSQNTTINYPENAYRYLQVKIFSGGEEPLRITGARVSKILQSTTKEISITPQREIIQNAAKRATEIIIDLEKRGWPTSSVLLESKNRNFNREIVIYESDDKSNWRRLGGGNIFNYQTAKFTGSDLSVSYSESGCRYLKIEIYNGDDQPISIDKISVKAVLRSIAFQAVPGKNYRLCYGNKNARFPEYDLEKYFRYLETDNCLIADLAAEQNNPEFKEKIPPQKPLTERIPYLLPAVLILAVSILGFFIFRFMKETKK